MFFNAQGLNKKIDERSEIIVTQNETIVKLNETMVAQIIEIKNLNKTIDQLQKEILCK